MSNKNKFWGSRFGFVSKVGELVFPVKQMTTGPSISGPHQVQPDPNSPRGKQAAADREKFIREGRPVHYHRSGKRVKANT